MKKILSLLFTVCLFSQAVCGDVSWSSPATLSSALVDASQPQIVMDPDGNATALWVESGLVKSSSYPVGGSWGSSVTLSGSGSASPLAGVDDSGNVIAIWVESGVVKTATLPFGGSWSASTAVSSSGASEPALDVDTSGNAVAVWVRGGYIESAKQLFGGSWSLVSQLSTGGSEDAPQVAIGEDVDGTTIAVWHSNVSGDQLFSSSTPIAGSWTTPKNLAAVITAFSLNFPQVAVDANGNAVALGWRYQKTNGIYQNITLLSVSLPKGASGWSALPTFLSNPGLVRDPSKLTSYVSFDSNGNAVAVWTNSYDGQTFNFETTTRPNGGNWAPSVLIEGLNLFSYSVDVAANNTLGDAVAAYMAFDGVSSAVIRSVESTISGPTINFWSIPQTISQGSENGYPRIASVVSGSDLNAAAIWISSDGVNNQVVASVGTKTVVLPPSNLDVVQSVRNFDVFDEFYNTITWDASSSPDLVQYNIYRDGVFFTSVDSSTLQVTDDNADEAGTGAPVTYGVAAADSTFSQSAIVTITLP